MSFLKRTFGIQGTAFRFSAGSGDTELMAIEEGRSVDTDGNGSELLGAGSRGSTQPFRLRRLPADRVPVDNHPLAPESLTGEFPTLQSHTSQLAANGETPTPSVPRVKRRAHPYHADFEQDSGRKVRVVETVAPLTQRYKREVKGRLATSLRAEIEQELRRGMDEQWTMQKAQLRDGFEHNLALLLEKAGQEHKEAMTNEREQFLLKLDQAQQATESALKMAEEATTETKRMVEMMEQTNMRAEKAEKAAAKATLQADEALNHRLQALSLELEQAKVVIEAATRRAEESAEETKEMVEKLEQANVRAERAEAVTAKDVFQADEALNHRLHQLSLELEDMKTATRAAMRRAEESAEETKKMAEELEQAHAHTRQVENEMATATGQIKQLEERERLIRQETETLRKLDREREEEIGKMAEMLNQADIRVQGAETSANVAAKRAKVTETRDEARDAGMRAVEMEVNGNDLNRSDGPEVGQNADNSFSSKIEISTSKGKGVARVQDSDDERDVSSTIRQVQYAISSDEETGSVKTLQDRPNSASGPSAMDIDRPTRSATNQMNVPPPQSFKRPKGGTRPGLGAAMLDEGRSHFMAKQHAKANQHNTPSHRSKKSVNWNKAGQGGNQDEVDTAKDDDSDVINTTPRNNPRRKKYFKKTPLRGSNAERAQKLSSVRRTMNTLLGIKKDDEVMKIELATREEVEAYAEGEEDVALELQPMRPYFESTGPTAWNSALCDLFLEYFATEQDVDFDEDEREEIEEMFENRIQTLRKKRKEMTHMSKEGLQAKKTKSDKQSRANSRRDRKWDDRRQICIEQLDDSTNEAGHPGWKATLKILDTAGPSIVSSDESGWEGTQRVYSIRKRKWRSAEVTRRMQEVDEDQNITNAYGGSRAGNAPRRRIRISDAPASTRAAVAGLPENCYSKGWVSNLDGRMQKALGMKRRLELGKI